MNKISAIFLILLTTLTVTYCMAGAFKDINRLLKNFKNSNIKEQRAADIRERKAKLWCNKYTGRAKTDLGKRRKAHLKLKKDLAKLRKLRKKWIKDRKHRRGRIIINAKLLKKFKKQRCDSNILFVKNLREHMEGLTILRFLRKDIVQYFRRKSNKTRPSFLAVNMSQKIDSLIQFSGLLDDNHRLMLTELSRFASKVNKHVRNVKRFTKVKKRTKKQIGKGHIDNRKKALKRLKTPKWERKAKFNLRTKRRILGMIDALIKHLRKSRARLTRDELRASNDFAVFQSKMLKENAHLRRSIKKLTRKIKNMIITLAKAVKHLKRLWKLVKNALKKLRRLKALCTQKFAYFRKETRRRKGENRIINKAKRIFKRLLNRALKTRAGKRAEKAYAGKRLKHRISRVVKAAPGTRKRFHQRRSKRNAVVF